MKELESSTKSGNPVSKAIPSTTHPPTMEQLRAKTTDELVKILMSAEMGKPMNAALRQQIITILQQREGNAFVQRLLGKSAEKK